MPFTVHFLKGFLLLSVHRFPLKGHTTLLFVFSAVEMKSYTWDLPLSFPFVLLHLYSILHKQLASHLQRTKSVFLELLPYSQEK